jgi:hypothetical protein
MFTWVRNRRGAAGAPAVGGALVLVGALALAACGGAGSATSNKVASLSGSNANTTTTISKADLETAALNYARCMRAHGVNIPDPQFDSNGRPIFNRTGQGGRGFFFGPGDGGKGAETSPQNSAFRKAREACQQYADAFRSAFQPNAQQLAQMQKNLLAFAKCMRDNGVNFPDPTFDSNGRPQFDQNGATNFRQLLESPAAQKAEQTCRSKVGGNGGPGFFFGGGRGGPGGGSGPTSASTPAG